MAKHIQPNNSLEEEYFNKKPVTYMIYRVTSVNWHPVYGVIYYVI